MEVRKMTIVTLKAYFHNPRLERTFCLSIDDLILLKRRGQEMEENELHRTYWKFYGDEGKYYLIKSDYSGRRSYSVEYTITLGSKEIIRIGKGSGGWSFHPPEIENYFMEFIENQFNSIEAPPEIEKVLTDEEKTVVRFALYLKKNNIIEKFVNRKIYLANAFSLGMLNHLDKNLIRVEKVATSEVKEILSKSHFISVIGHEGTAELISKKLGLPVSANRIQVKLERGDILVVFQLLQRLPEGTLL
jgi:hypothetical protein